MEFLEFPNNSVHKWFQIKKRKPPYEIYLATSAN